jgi:hypothetical protein
MGSPINNVAVITGAARYVTGMTLPVDAGFGVM